MEEQLDALRQSLQDQSSAARRLTSGIEAQLEDIQRQVTQVTLTFRLNSHYVSLQSLITKCVHWQLDHYETSHRLFAEDEFGLGSHFLPIC